jgi:GT2 family glycosyltransferase
VPTSARCAFGVRSQRHEGGPVTPEEIEARLEWLAREQRNQDRRLARIEDGVLFRAARWAGVRARSWAVRFGYAERYDYPAWIEQHEAARPGDGLAREPLISILMPVRGAKKEWLDAAIASVRIQSYRHWQLIVCMDGDGPPPVVEDSRVCVTRVRQEAGVSAALNHAASAATGEYLTVLDQDDTLAEHALGWIATAVQDGSADLLYSDEDLTDAAGRPLRPIFKPGWSPELLTSAMYFGHLLVVSRAAFDRVGGFRSEYDGSQDHDLALRVTEQPGVRVAHVPRVLYHWRQHAGSSAGRPESKPEAHEAGRRAVADAMRRRGIAAEVRDGRKPFAYSVQRKPRGGTLASIVICSCRPRLLARCLQALRSRTTYSPYETVLVQHGFSNPLGDHRLPWTGPFDFAAMNNAAVNEAKGDVLVFLNDDVRPLDSDWLDALVAQVERPEVGIAGALLEYADGAIQHAGVVIGIADAAAHPLRGLRDSPLWNWAPLTRNVSAVTGACLAIQREVFEQLRGFNTAFPVNYNDVDLCLRLHERGYRNVWLPGVELIHHESATRGAEDTPERQKRLASERAYMRARWGALLAQDPYYSPNFSLEDTHDSLAVPPRAVRPWWRTDGAP